MSIWMIVLAAYLLIGVTLALIGRAARERRRQRLELEWEAGRPPRWKLHVFSIAVATGVVLLWPFLVVSAARSERVPTSAWDALQSNPAFREQQELYTALTRLCEDGVDADELPNGWGEFGLVPTNPIPCGTVFSSVVYLSRLRASDGAKVVYRRLGSAASDVSLHPVDGYEITHPDGRKLATLFLSPYQRRNSQKAPRGFELAPMTSS
jgi:hypothetical protein